MQLADQIIKKAGGQYRAGQSPQVFQVHKQDTKRSSTQTEQDQSITLHLYLRQTGGVECL